RTPQPLCLPAVKLIRGIARLLHIGMISLITTGVVDVTDDLLRVLKPECLLNKSVGAAKVQQLIRLGEPVILRRANGLSIILLANGLVLPFAVEQRHINRQRFHFINTEDPPLPLILCQVAVLAQYLTEYRVAILAFANICLKSLRVKVCT